jgi:REP element-mobilizing transposase RayT
MPRLARLDIAGLLQHVIVRGIERRDIFSDDIDRQNFVDRVITLLSETGVRCYAWAILSNHFHLLLKPTATPLASFMRRLLTGYAMSFNRRHTRSGHLFQNRYKSIVCEEEPYLLELVRYIHLNPLTAGAATRFCWETAVSPGRTPTRSWNASAIGWPRPNKTIVNLLRMGSRRGGGTIWSGED